MPATVAFNTILIVGLGQNPGTTRPTITAGIAYFENFSVTDLEVRAVPEPSTYAAIVGPLALGIAFFRRR